MPSRKAMRQRRLGTLSCDGVLTRGIGALPRLTYATDSHFVFPAHAWGTHAWAADEALDALNQVPALQAAEKPNSLKGTAFRPSVTDGKSVRPLRGPGFAPCSTFFRN